jgi:hypothetical protein
MFLLFDLVDYICLITDISSSVHKMVFIYVVLLSIIDCSILCPVSAERLLCTKLSHFMRFK